MDLNVIQEKLLPKIKSLRGTVSVKRVAGRGNPCIVSFSTKLMLKRFLNIWITAPCCAPLAALTMTEHTMR